MTMWIGNLLRTSGWHPVRVFPGNGILAGSLPDEVDGPDGRAKKLNVPAMVRIVVIDKASMRVVAGARSAADGTWRVEGLDPTRYYTVIGFDQKGEVNAAIQDWITPHVEP